RRDELARTEIGELEQVQEVVVVEVDPQDRRCREQAAERGHRSTDGSLGGARPVVGTVRQGHGSAPHRILEAVGESPGLKVRLEPKYGSFCPNSGNFLAVCPGSSYFAPVGSDEALRDLLAHLERISPLAPPELGRLVDELLAYFS